MTTARVRRPFDHAAFKRQLHACALKRGIDPIEGATSYQAALVQAEFRIARTRAAADYGWWKTRDIFNERTDRQGAMPRLIVPLDAVCSDGLVRLDEWAMLGILREMHAALTNRHELPLRTVHRLQLDHIAPSMPPQPAKRKRARWELAGGGVPVRAVG